LGRLPLGEREKKAVARYLGRASTLAARERHPRDENARERGFGLGDESLVADTWISPRNSSLKIGNGPAADIFALC
jgi:hypothetical protein